MIRSSSKRLFSTSAAAASTSKQPQQTLAIAGGGLSGLSSAFFCLRDLSPSARRKTRIVILEKEDRVGGWCRSVSIPVRGSDTKGKAKASVPDLVFETGPRSIRPVGLAGWLTISMAHTLGLTPSILTVPKSAPSAKNRFLYFPSSLTLLPSSLISAFTSLFTSPLIRSTIPGVLSEPFRPKSVKEDESVDEFFSRRFGKPMAENMISAMIHGIYSGDTRRLSIRAVFPGLWELEKESGSIVLGPLLKRFKKGKNQIDSRYRQRMAREEEEKQDLLVDLRESQGGSELIRRMEEASVWGLEGGIDRLTDELRNWLKASGVEFWDGERGDVQSVQYNRDFWTIKTKLESLASTHLITSAPSILSKSLPPPLSDSLTIPSSTVSVVNLAFPTPTPPSPPLFPPGFGYLIPRSVSPSQNPHQVLGVIFDSDVMPSTDNSASLGLTKITLIMGGSYWLDSKNLPIPFPPSQKTLIRNSLETLKLHFPETNFPEPSYELSNTHVECIPQVPVGMPGVFEKVNEALVELNGNGRAKVGVVGGGVGVIGINGAVMGGWEVGRSFARDLEFGEEKVETGLGRWQS